MGESNGTSSRYRLALAATVALACTAGLGGALALLRVDAPPDLAPGGSASAQRTASVPDGHGVRPPGVSERRLREIETLTLGPAHAREHAMLRRALRRGRPRAESPAADGRMAIAAAEPGSPADVGRWDPSATVTFPIVAIHAALLPTGKVMVFSFPKSPYENTAQVWLWNPANGALTRKDPPPFVDPVDGQLKPANIWCSGHTFTADGELVVFGGNLDFPKGTKSYKGLNKVYTFNPFTETWREQPDMQHGRWYPSGVRMADGRIPIISGWDESGDDVINEDVELFTPPAAIGGLGTTTVIGGTGGAGEPPTGEYYPHMFTMPSGRTLVAGPDRQNTWFFNTVTQSDFTWSDAPNLGQRRLWGTAVPMPGEPNRIMALGGTNAGANPSTRTTEVFDEANPGAGWQPAAPNEIGRGHANTVLLPDGSMVHVGGGVGSRADAPSPLHAADPEQRQIELWDPLTREWRLGPAQAESRAYHSTALLLPDGRVLSAGDDFNGGISSDTGELYEPPYLHRGARPTITSAPQAITLGAGFGVATPNLNIKRAALVAPSSVTHAVDMNQRFIPLQVTQRSGCVDVEAPSDVDVAPPGYYMLFLLNDQGVPSVARFVKLQTAGSVAACQAPPPPPDTTPPSVSASAPSTASGEIELTATASDNVGVVGVRFRVDGVNVGNEDTSSPYSTTWDTREVQNGTYEVTAVARDAAGNTTESAPVQVTVSNTDATPPVVTLTAPEPGSTVSGTTTVAATATDNVAVEAVQFKLDGVDLGPEDTSAPYSVSWNTTDVPNGIHQLTAVARDTSDNEDTSPARTVTVQNAPPPVEPAPVEPGPGVTPPAPAPPAGQAQPVEPPAAPPDAPPRILGLKLSRTAFRTRVRIGFRLSEPATVTMSFERRLRGRRLRGRCVRAKPRQRPNCTRHVRLNGAIALQAKAGVNSVPFGGRLSRARRLPPGSYRLTLVATDPGGQRSAPARAGFRLLATAKRRRSGTRASLLTSAIGKLGLPAAASEDPFP